MMTVLLFLQDMFIFIQNFKISNTFYSAITWNWTAYLTCVNRHVSDLSVCKSFYDDMILSRLNAEGRRIETSG